MKSIFAKLSVTIIPIIALAALVTLSTGITRKAGRYQPAAMSQVQPGPQIPGHSYSEVMDNLFSSLGR